MAGNKSTQLANDFLNAIFQMDGYTAPTDLYIAAYTADPGDDDTGTEIDTEGTGYARVDVAVSFTTVASSREIANDVLIEFPEATASWGTVTHIGVRNAVTAGDLLWHANLEIEKPISAGDQLRFKIGDLKFMYQASA